MLPMGPTPEPPAPVASWADVLPDPLVPPGEWDSEDLETGDLVTSQSRNVGKVGRVDVYVFREDRCHEGAVTIGDMRVMLGEVPWPGLSPDEAAELGRLVLVASVEARRLQGQP